MEKLTKKKLSLIHTRCLNLIRKKPPEFLVFKKLRYYGWCYDSSFGIDEQIIVDHRKSPIRTVYHECLHYLYPDWSETKVLNVESKMVNRLSMLEIANFMKIFSIKFYENELKKARSKKRKKTKRKKPTNKNKTVD